LNLRENDGQQGSILLENDLLFYFLLSEGDYFILDRGFRDAIDLLNNKNNDAKPIEEWTEAIYYKRGKRIETVH
jgi:hypothetical protein